MRIGRLKVREDVVAKGTLDQLVQCNVCLTVDDMGVIVEAVSCYEFVSPSVPLAGDKDPLVATGTWVCSIRPQFQFFVLFFRHPFRLLWK